MSHSARGIDKRPDPDALLALASKESRGNLTLFLGAAPGVGKTYAMLTRARKLRADGIDIVVGIVETHGRSETAALLDGLEIIPRRKISYQGRDIEEFDLDATLARKPKIVIVDELAHTNAPDCRHPKRFQDIEELLDAEIHVWSAINIQHLESLADVVASITGIQVRERVPDTVLDRADEVLLVDIGPNELLQRLKEGKVYLPENAKRATESFFKIGNLTALREMALRRTADRVDDQMVDYLKQNAIEGPWQSSERLLVCLGPNEHSEKVLRVAARLASSLNAPLLAISLERPDRGPNDNDAGNRIDALFKLAEGFGAETRRLSSSDFVNSILTLARRENVTQIIIGKSHRPSWLTGLWRSALTDHLIRHASGISIHVVADLETASPNKRPLIRPGARMARKSWIDIALSAVFVGLATAIGLAIGNVIEFPNVASVYLLAVIASAVRGGYPASLAAAVFSALAYNFFFIEPIRTFTIAAPFEVVGLMIYLMVAIIAGALASRLRLQAESAHARASSTQLLYDYSRKLSGASNVDDIAWAAVSQVQSALRRSVVFLLEEDRDLAVKAAWPPDTELDVAAMTAARWAFGKQEPAGKSTGTLPNCPFQFRPLASHSGAIGVIGFLVGEKPIPVDDDKVLSTLMDQTAIAIDRARLSAESLEQAAKLEGERLRSSLLSSISHDLKTPLATITGAISSLRQLGDRMQPESRDDLLATIEEESDQLTRFLGNLLDMTKIEAGVVNAKREWLDVNDVINIAVERARRYYPGYTIDRFIAADLPLVLGDSVLLGQVLFNLIDNAIKYSGEKTVSVYARRDADEIVLSVSDMGKGIPPRELQQVFEKFFRRNKSDGRKPGTGLGLAIAKGFVEAMGGTIKAESPALKRRGTRIVMRFKVDNPKEAK